MSWPLSTLGMTLAGFGVVGSLIWLGDLIWLATHGGDAMSLADLPDQEPESGWPSLAVVFAARDEAAMVEAATRSLLAQDYPELTIIAVDDRSTDGTGAILDAIAAEDPRLRVVHVRELPPGWLGKTHALHEAARSTSADWILFTDADVVFARGALRKALALAEREGLDHVVVLPEIPTESVGERLFLSLFGLVFGLKATVGRVSDRSSKAHVGVGAFNLVRAEAFWAIGGFARIALSVDDDMRLGQALKYAGYPMKLLLGAGSVSVRWQVGLGGMIRGLEKNFFAGVDYRLEKALLAALALTTAGIAPYVGLFVGPWWTRAVCLLGVASVAGLLGLSSRFSGIRWYYALVLPLATVTVLISLARSVALTLARGGVRWRGHHYPLAQLRHHVRLRDAWTREVWRSTR